MILKELRAQILWAWFSFEALQIYRGDLIS